MPSWDLIPERSPQEQWSIFSPASLRLAFAAGALPLKS